MIRRAAPALLFLLGCAAGAGERFVASSGGERPAAGDRIGNSLLDAAGSSSHVSRFPVRASGGVDRQARGRVDPDSEGTTANPAQDGVTLEEARSLALERHPTLQVLRSLADRRPAGRVSGPRAPGIVARVLAPAPVAAAETFRPVLTPTGDAVLSEADAERMRSFLSAAEQAVRFRISCDFFHALRLAKSFSLQEELARSAARLVEAAESREKAGQLPQMDVDAMRVHLEKTLREKEIRGRIAAEARLRLARRIGKNGELNLKGEFPPREIPDADKAHAFASTRRREAGRKNEMEPAGEPVRVAAWEDPLGVLDLRWVWPAEGFVPAETGPAGEAEGSVRKQVDEALARLREAAALARALEERTLPLARRNLENTEQAFDAGEVGALAMLHAIEDWREVSEELFDALEQYACARAALEVAIGGGLAEIP